MPVDRPFPKRPPDENHGEPDGLAGLKQRERLEQLIHRAEAAGKRDERFGADEEVHLAQGKIPELEAQLRRNVGVRPLLVRQGDVQADGFASRIRRPPICRLHDAGSTAGDDHVVAPSVGLTGGGDQPSEFAGDVVIGGQLKLPAGRGRRAGELRIARSPSRGVFGEPERFPRGGWFLQPGAAEDDDGRLDSLLFLNQLRFQQLKPEAEGTEFFALEKVEIAIGGNVRRSGKNGVKEAGIPSRRIGHGTAL
ncbi:hypothetical protein NITMOv2_0244 [Nitrospira moscoviensis]|uniref:Uncharacterized protein n=1 Tax=Nitrospira moscoviensis TaxID=42253 RepID=A0A0K2G6V7_NITMO|nr:hypothetical protein NITMOv2_0244 [Nitrospira moscoviensis]